MPLRAPRVYPEAPAAASEDVADALDRPRSRLTPPTSSVPGPSPMCP
jgi:hypothetical protein